MRSDVTCYVTDYDFSVIFWSHGLIPAGRKFHLNFLPVISFIFRIFSGDVVLFHYFCTRIHFMYNTSGKNVFVNERLIKIKT